MTPHWSEKKNSLEMIPISDPKKKSFQVISGKKIK
jgi:hypothetical protein